MQVYSLTRNSYEFIPLEVEVSLMPGLPRFHIMGLPDMAIKESQARIKSALRHQGFDLPRHQQVLVNLKPLHLKKSSRGLDLAIACAYLWESGQVPLPSIELKKICIYGELNLEGEIQIPDDFEDIDELKATVLSAEPSSPPPWHWLAANQLKDLCCLKEIYSQKRVESYERPSIPETYFTSQQARLMSLVGCGEHSLLMAGPAGSGKTTVVENLHKVLSDPSFARYRESRKISRSMGVKEPWRPFVAPHHSIPVMSMLGGGSPPIPGEISRAHGGVLALDEFLEFHPYVRESLREPIEKKSITVSRRGLIRQFPADFLLLATTNLCPCGDYVPQRPTRCRLPLGRCRSHMDKMSGPLLDRFAILAFSHQWEGAFEVSLKDIRENIKSARGFAMESRGQKCHNSQLKLEELEVFVDDFTRENLLPGFEGSHRRKLFMLQIARSLADLEEQEVISQGTLREAMENCFRPFQELKFGVI